jgi:hypothetical protein
MDFLIGFEISLYEDGLEITIKLLRVPKSYNTRTHTWYVDNT